MSENGNRATGAHPLAGAAMEIGGTAEDLLTPEEAELVDAIVTGRDLRAAIESGVIEPSSLYMVAEFHAAFGAPLPQEPAIPPDDRAQLRIDLMTEELNELVEAIAKGDIVAAADALTDLQVVLDGTFLEFGLGAAKTALVAEVHRANMSKLGADGKPVLRDDGKILKGPGYTPPDLAPIVAVARGGP